MKVWESPYAWNSNNPIWVVDPSGGNGDSTTTSKTHTAEVGDSFWSIARDNLGDNASMSEITKEMNRIANMNGGIDRTIEIGDKILLVSPENDQTNVPYVWKPNTQEIAEAQEATPAEANTYGVTVAGKSFDKGSLVDNLTMEQLEIMAEAAGVGIDELLIGNQSSNAKLAKFVSQNSQLLGRISSVSKGAGSGLAVISFVDDSYQFSNGDLSGERYTYRTVGLVASGGAAILISNPVGLVVGAVFVSGEYVYDDATNEGGGLYDMRQKINNAFYNMRLAIQQGKWGH